MSVLLSRWSRLYRGTPSELALEPHLARMGEVYRFQHPEWRLGVILDFAFPEHRLALEVDGSEHFTKAGKAKDEERTKKLEALGWRVVRCSNDEAVNDPETVVLRVRAAMETKNAPKSS